MKLERYEAYNDSGVEWIGEIPEEWYIKKAKWLFKQEKREVKKDDKIVTCFRDGQVTLRANRRTDGFTNALKEHGYQGIRKDDLVIHNMDAFAGAIGISDSDGKSTPVYSVCTAYNEKEIVPYFYALYLRSLAKKGFIESLAKGIRERSTDFRFADFKDLFLPIPPFHEQTKIADFLDQKTAQIDKAISLKEKLIEKLKEYRQILINDAVTKGLDKNVKMKDSGVEWIGKVPEGWRIEKGKRLFRHLKRAIREEDEIVTCFRDGEVTLRKNRRIDGFTNALKEHGYQGIRKGDLVIHNMDAFAGAIGISDSNGKSTPVYSVCVPWDENSILPEYYAYYLRHLAVQGFILSLAKGIRERSTDFRFNDFGELLFPVPPKDTQIEIMKYINGLTEKIDKAINQQQEQIEKLKEYKASLIDSVVTGKVKII